MLYPKNIENHFFLSDHVYRFLVNRLQLKAESTMELIMIIFILSLVGEINFSSETICSADIICSADTL